MGFPVFIDHINDFIDYILTILFNYIVNYTIYVFIITINRFDMIEITDERTLYLHIYLIPLRDYVIYIYVIFESEITYCSN